MTDRERSEALLDKLLIGPESGTQEDWRDAINAVLQHDRATRAAVWREAADLTLKLNCERNHGPAATVVCDDLESLFREREQRAKEEA